MSDTEEITRKIPGGSKIIEKVEKTVEDDGEPNGKQVERAVKRRKIDEIPAESSVPTPGPAAPLDPLKAKEEEIHNLEQTMGEDWYEALEGEFSKQYFKGIKNFLIAETRRKRVIYPPTKDIYSWSRLTPLADVKVIIVGQDPYHGPNQAHGLSFSVLPPTRPPPSLVNIYKELARSIPGFVIPKSGDLSPLAAQGVLWLNTALTVRSGEPSSHSKQGWDKFTRAVMETVLKRPDHKGVVFMAWGAHAQKAINGFDKKKNKILKSRHPSPFSALTQPDPFIGNNHFKLANEWLREEYGPEGEVDWTVLNPKK